MCNIDVVVLLITFMKREMIMLFPCSLGSATDEINKSIHMVFFLVVSSYSFDALFFLSFNLC